MGKPVAPVPSWQLVVQSSVSKSAGTLGSGSCLITSCPGVLPYATTTGDFPAGLSHPSVQLPRFLEWEFPRFPAPLLSVSKVWQGRVRGPRAETWP